MIFKEKASRRMLNARIVRRARLRPAVLSDGRKGVMISLSGQIVCMSEDEAYQLTDRIADVLEAEHEVD